MTLAYIGGGILLWIPTIMVSLLKIEKGFVKYICVVCSAVFVMLLSTTLTYHVVVIYVYPIAIASLYFFKRLNIAATILTVIGVSVGQILAFYLNTLQDDNFMTLKGTIVFGIIPRTLVLIAVAAIFTMLTSRTASMLSNLLGAEEQKELLEHMNRMKENAADTSETLFGMVSELAEITESASFITASTIELEKQIHSIDEAAEMIRRSSDEVADSMRQINDNTQQNCSAVEHVTASTQENTASTESLAEIVEQIRILSDKLNAVVNG